MYHYTPLYNVIQMTVKYVELQVNIYNDIQRYMCMVYLNDTCNDTKSMQTQALDKQIEAYLVEPKVVWQDLFGGSDVYHSGPISGGVVYENKVIDSLRKSFGNGISIVRAWIVEHSRITFLLLSVVLLIAGHTCSSRASCFPWSQRGELTCFRSKKGFSLV